MEKNVDMNMAKRVFDKICSLLERYDEKYDKCEEKLMVSSTLKGKDLPIKYCMAIEPARKILIFMSDLPFEIPKNRTSDMAMAVCIANLSMTNGLFEFDISKGTIRYRLTLSYLENEIGDISIIDMMSLSVNIIEEYNDKLFLLVCGIISLDEFAKFDESVKKGKK